MAKRSKTKVYVSKKQIVDIEEFMRLYIGKEYTWNLKLTHKNMELFLKEKGKALPKRVCFDSILKEDILTGNFIVVKDKASQILVYKNPRITLTELLIDLKMNYNEDDMQLRRNKVLENSKVLVKRR